MTSKSFFIGDVHGRADLLKSILDHVERLCILQHVTPTVFFLGDLVDRGLQSKEVLDLVIATMKKWPGSITIRGNHDDMFLAAMLDDVGTAKSKHWYDNCGGWDTCASYDVEGDLGATRKIIAHRYPDHLSLVMEAPYMIEEYGFVVCHAGINAWLPLGEQSPHDLMWISDGFIDRVDETMPIVIHGHTIIGDLPVITENRISIDTGAYENGRLTCLMLDPALKSLRFFQTSETEVVDVDPVIHNRGRGSILDRNDLFS